MEVIEKKGIQKYLEKRQLIQSYRKQKALIHAGYYELVDLKKRNPKSAGISYFRINQQYRAIGFIENNTFIVTEISDHQ
jgi:plasmid maintenance system killer protein